MNRSVWNHLVGGLFCLLLVTAALGLISSPGDKVTFAAVMAVMAGALLLWLVLPKIREFSIGPQGVTGKVDRLETELEKTKEIVDVQGSKVAEQQVKIEQQQELINNLVRYSMSASIFHHLCGIVLLWRYDYHDGDASRREMYFLRDNGFIEPKVGDFIDFDKGIDGRNLVEIAEPTPIGKSCVRLRKDEVPSDMLVDRPNLRIDPANL